MKIFDSMYYICAAAFISSFVFSGLLVKTIKFHGNFTMDANFGIQKFHVSNVPRVGGLAILFGVFTGLFLYKHYEISTSDFFSYSVLAALPVFIFGILEDLTKKIKPFTRLVAGILSGILAMLLMDYRINNLDFNLLNSLIKIEIVSYAFTVFCIAGVIHSYNIIDGFNGLSSASMACAILSFAMVSVEADDYVILILSMTIFSSILGFLLWNYPFGKIFMGDGGAYLTGFFVVWIAIVLPERNNIVSPWSSLLICLYPITETVYTSARRMISKSKLSEPDSLHLHSLVKIVLIRPYCIHFPDWAKNSIVLLILSPFVLLPPLLGFLFFDNTKICMVCSLIFVITYRCLYAYLSRRNRKLNSI